MGQFNPFSFCCRDQRINSLEVLVKPLREGKSHLVSLYRAVLLGMAGLTLFPVTRSILESAAHLRAATNLKTPDAIHAATALSCHATVFVTNDVAFRHVQGLAVTILSELAAP